MTTEDPFALLDAIRALNGHADELSRARRLALQKRLWQYQWEQVFRGECERNPADYPLIEDRPDR